MTFVFYKNLSIFVPMSIEEALVVDPSLVPDQEIVKLTNLLRGHVSHYIGNVGLLINHKYEDNTLSAYIEHKINDTHTVRATLLKTKFIDPRHSVILLYQEFIKQLEKTMGKKTIQRLTF